MSSFNSELYKCKAVQLEDDKTVVCGFYFDQNNQSCVRNDNGEHVVNPYTVCRNTGIMLETGFLYEWDLVEYIDGNSDENWGYIEWDDYSKAFAVRSSLNYSSKRSIRDCNRSIGNIILNREDADKMQQYSDAQDRKEHSHEEPECRSKQHLNKLAKQFLPR